MNDQRRWTLLKHTGAPNDINGFHYDLLLEDGIACRTWRLSKIPVLNGQAVEAECAPLHKLVWLETIESAVSGGKGWAKRVESGFFNGKLPISRNYPINVQLFSQTLSGILEISHGFCRLTSGKSKNHKYP
tara:strand:+ start:134 stop:526 length:393 start_codon:yes stop_codon:yes gene_type:complete